MIEPGGMIAPADDVAAIARAGSCWLRRDALPLWLERGVDRAAGGFHEFIDPATGRGAGRYKRLRVTARQIFVFADAARHGDGDARDAVEHGLAYLLGPLRGDDGGFANRTDLTGRITDGRLVLYDLAFALLALAHGYSALRDEALVDEAADLVSFCRARLSHPGGGFIECLGEQGAREQNPHMHLLEAALAWREHGGGGRAALLLIEDLVELAATRFVDPVHGAVIEEFDEHWNALAPWCEPGHQYEWMWLAAETRRATGRRFDLSSAAMFSGRHGVQPETGLLWGRVRPDGTPVDAAVRLWPHAEWLRASLTENDGRVNDAWHALARFLDHPTPGLWHERWDGSRFPAEPVPASSLYHLSGACQALERAVPAAREGDRRGAVFLDRDGVLNDDLGYVGSRADLRWTSGAAAAIRRINEAGLLAVVVTNQSGVARGFYSESDMVALHQAMRAELADEGAVLDAIYACPFHPDAVDPCYRAADHPDRKPNPGMLLRAIRDLGIDPGRSAIIGDKPSDLEAGRRAGIPGFLFEGGDLDRFVQRALSGRAR